MHMVVNVLASNHWCNRVALFGTSFSPSVLELHTLLLKTGLDGVWVAVLVFAVLDRDHVMVMLLWEHLTILDGLNGGVVVILVYLAVDGSGCFFMTVLAHLLIDDCGGNLFMNSGIMMTSFVPRRTISSAAEA